MSQENDKKGFWGNTFSRLKSALSKTKEAVIGPITNQETSPTAERDEAPGLLKSQDIVFSPSSLENITPPKITAIETVTSKVLDRPLTIDSDYLEDLEDKLIRADLGLATVNLLIDHLRKHARGKAWTEQDVQSFLKDEFSKMLTAAPSHKLKIEEGHLNIILVVGVNGTGKTTSIGKLCHRLQCQGRKTLIAAADTFRAAAESQLEIWARRAQCDLVRLAAGSDPGAVVFQAIKKAQSENYQMLVIDTAGRLHNKANLMAELRKIQSVIEKNANGANFEALLVLDASTGQNGIQQARVFSEVCPLTGVILTKLDGTAKGGVIFSIANELKIPVKLIGVGRKN